MIPLHLEVYNDFLEKSGYEFVKVIEDETFPIIEYIKDGNPCVIKVLDGMNAGENEIHIIVNEIKINNHIKSEVSDAHKKFLVAPIDILCDNEGDQTIFIVMERMNGTLHNINTKFFIKNCNQIVSKIFKCIYVMHKNNMVHADLKSDNIFYKIVNGKFEIKIGDFGTSNFLDATEQDIMCGTYIPEDMIINNGLMEDYRKIDYWQIAITLYCLFTDNQQDFYNKKLTRDEIDFENIYNTISQIKNPYLSKFLLDCLGKLIKPNKTSKTKQLFSYIENNGRCRAKVKDRSSKKARICKKRGRYFGYCDTHKDLFKNPR